MTVEELEQQKQRIIDLIAELEESDRYLEEATQPIEPSVALGRLTRMEAIGEKSVNQAMLGNVKKRLERLRNALDRMDKGIYGDCIRCGQAMPQGRLEAVPEALLCVACAEKR